MSLSRSSRRQRQTVPVDDDDTTHESTSTDTFIISHGDIAYDLTFNVILITPHDHESDGNAKLFTTIHC